MNTWFFSTTDNSDIVLQMRAEGDKIVGDAFSTCSPGGSVLNLSYEYLASIGSGKIEIKNNIAVVMK